MRLICPNCGARDSREFTYRGAAKAMARPNAETRADGDMFDYVYLRANSAEVTAELWHHTHGCRAWLHVRRNTTTHEVLQVEFARDRTADPVEDPA